MERSFIETKFGQKTMIKKESNSAGFENSPKCEENFLINQKDINQEKIEENKIIGKGNEDFPQKKKKKKILQI